MVKIVGYKTYEREDGENFFGLIVQGGIEVVKSVKTGRNYFTARTATVPTTFSLSICEGLVGSTLEGQVKKVPCDLYEYTVKDTEEVLELNYRYEYITDEEGVLESNVLDKDLVI